MTAKLVALFALLSFALGGFPSVADQQATTLRIVLAQPADSRDPHYSQRPGGWLLARLLHRGLYGFPADPYPQGAQPLPDIATALPSFTADGRTATIRIRSGLRFPNGSDVDALAVVKSLRRFVRAGTEVADSIPFLGVVAPDARTIRIGLSEPANDLAWLLAHPSAAVMPPQAPGRGAVPGLGPYRFETDRPQGRSVLVRNERWHDDPLRAAWPDRVEIQVVSGSVQAFRAVRLGEADMVGDPGSPDAWRATATTPLESASRCVRLLVAEPAGALSTGQLRRQVAKAVRRMAGGVGAMGLFPPILVGGGRPLPAEPSSGATRLARPLILAITDTPRDIDDAEMLRSALSSIARIQVRRVSPYRLDRQLAASPRADLVLVTWCGPVPGLGGASFLERLVGPKGLVGRSTSLNRLVASARRADDSDLDAAWRMVQRQIRSEALLMPLSYPPERGAFGSRLVEPASSPMFPQGDPTNLRLSFGT